METRASGQRDPDASGNTGDTRRPGTGAVGSAGRGVGLAIIVAAGLLVGAVVGYIVALFSGLIAIIC